MLIAIGINSAFDEDPLLDGGGEETLLFFYPIVGAALGAGLGALIGANVHTEWWDDIQLGYIPDDRPGITVGWSANF